MFNNVLPSIINMEEIPVIEVHRADSTNLQGQECWVIEAHVNKDKKFFAGYYFEQDFEKAVRFCRKQDAQAVREHFSPLKGFKVVQHIWL